MARYGNLKYIKEHLVLSASLTPMHSLRHRLVRSRTLSDSRGDLVITLKMRFNQQFSVYGFTVTTSAR